MEFATFAANDAPLRKVNPISSDIHATFARKSSAKIVVIYRQVKSE